MTLIPVYPSVDTGDAFPNDGSRSGVYIYDDLTYDSTDLVVPGTGTFVALPNDAAGGLSATFQVNGITSTWNTSTNRFTFAQAKIGDIIETRLDCSVTTTAPNQSVRIRFRGAIGTPNEFLLSFIEASYKTTGVHEINRYTPIFITNTDDRDFPGVLEIASDDTLTVRNIRFFQHVITRGL